MRNSQTAVLVAKQDIPVGALIDSRMLGSAIVPNQYVQPQAATSLDRVAGMITIASISKGEQVILSKLKAPEKEMTSEREENLAQVTPPGKRAISIVADNIASLSGMIKPGDYVDVLAAVQAPVKGANGQITNKASVVPLFQNILVLAVGTNMAGATAASSRYAEQNNSGDNSLITLALDPEEANLIAFVQEQGKIRLIMRSLNDNKVEELAPANWDSLFKYVDPQGQNYGEQSNAQTVDNTVYVEVLRGLNKEKVPLAQ